MRATSIAVTGAFASFVVLSVACAGSSAPAESHDFNETQSEGGAATTEKQGGDDTSSSSSAKCGDAGDSGACAPHADAGRGGDANATADAAVSCQEDNTCQTAKDLGAMRGNEGTDTLSIQGAGPTWVKVRMTEVSHAWQFYTGFPMFLTATLVSPAGENFDLYVYGNPDTDTLECTNSMGKSTNPAGQDDVVHAKWGESCYYPNDIDESRTITIEIKSADGICSSNAKWTLVLQGNQSDC
jgi:hypothetical protein